ncbi:MAG: hypothetical protein A2539_00710 [Elusimicrobia bacterium RIFOXYD2_FULL_34_15]|nr:MAG: hypothetical protein A2539_00710 [Elusimicrobia bacterium RIFOXYD2_FULL_34_15]HAM38443.1 hypothetical protein [Elusimicrobiota bacterium]
MNKKLILILFVILNIYQIAYAENKTALQYYNSANKKYNNGDIAGAASDIKKAKELKKDDGKIKILVIKIAKDYFNRGGEKYNQGNLLNAIKDFDASLNLYEEKTVKDVYGLCLTELVGQVYSENNSYEKAIPHIRKLIELFPDELEYRQMYETANVDKQVVQNIETLPGITALPETVQTTQPQPAQVQQTQELVQAPQSQQSSQTVQPQQIEQTQQTPQIEKLYSLIESRLQKNEKLLKTYDKKQRDLIQKIYNNAEAKREKLLKEMVTSVVRKENIKTEKALKDTVSSALEKEGAGMKKTLFFTTTLGIVSMGGILGFLVLILTKYIKKRSAVILWHGEVGMAESLKQRTEELLLAKKRSLLLPSEMEDLRVIEAEIVEKTDAGAAENILSPFLKSNNSLTRAQAAKALFKHNPEKSLDILEDMLEKGDEQARIDSLATLGEIGTVESIKVLLDSINKLKYNEKKIVIRSLMKIVAENKEGIPFYLLEKIDNILSELKEKEGWLLE